jgi:hypothetical protein
VTDQDNDDEIRESIPCVTVAVGKEVYCLPVGYYITDDPKCDRWRVQWRGILLGDAYTGSSGAWQHAIEREKARRAKGTGAT